MNAWLNVRRERLAVLFRRSPLGLWLLDELPDPPGADGAVPAPKPDSDVGRPDHELEATFLTQWDAAVAEGKGGEDIILEQLQRDEGRREGSIRNVATDANALLGALSFMMISVGLVFASKIEAFLQSPARHSVWLLGVAFILIMRSHTVGFAKSWLTDYSDAGKRPAKTASKRELARRTRKVVNRLNVVLQRAKRKQSLAVVLLSAMALAVCVYISFG